MSLAQRVNDNYGHQVGDDVLKEVALRIQRCLRNNDYCARLGGDEFSILITQLDEPEYGEIIAKRIINAPSHPILSRKHKIFCKISIGLATYPSAGTDIETLIKNADFALYQAKATGGNTFEFFNDSFYELSLKNDYIFQLLTRPFRETFTLHFQGLYSLSQSSPSLEGYELLLRPVLPIFRGI